MYGRNDIKKVIYELKKKYSEKLIWHEFIDSSVDYLTGETTYNWVPHKIRRAILFPSQIDRGFKYSLSYIAANKNFTYGGLFDTSITKVLIDLKDFPQAFQKREINKSDKIVMDFKMYQISHIELFENVAMYVEMKHIKNQEPDAIYPIETQQFLEVKNG